MEKYRYLTPPTFRLKANLKANPPPKQRLEQQPPASGSGLSAEDYANLYGQYMNYGSNFNVGNISPFAEGGETQVNAESDRLIDLAAMAVSGQMSEEEAAVVIQAFIDEFGKALLELRAKAAILGELPEEEAGVVVQAFIDEFGEEAFSTLRESVLGE